MEALPKSTTCYLRRSRCRLPPLRISRKPTCQSTCPQLTCPAPATPKPPAPPALAAHPTPAHVAPLAGVSSATASRVLNGSARVSPTARQQVRDAVDQLGYVRQRAARAVDRRPRSVAAVVCEPNARLL